MQKQRGITKKLKISIPVKSRQGYQLARKTGWKFLNLRISDSHKKINRCKEILTNTQVKLECKLEATRMIKLLEYLKIKSSSEKTKAVFTHRKKLEGLSPLSFEKTKARNWIKNLSKRNLTENQVSILSKDSKFSLAPKRIPTLDIICGVEEGLRKVEREKKAFVDCARAKVTEILKRATPPLDNLTLGERKAIHCKRTSELR